ncbi:MAG: cupredoxin domain-containing protein [Humibacillus sp.]
MIRKISLLAVVPALALGLSACGSSTPQPGAAPAISSTSAMSSMPMPSESSSTTATSESGTTTAAAPSSSAPAAPAAPATAVLSISNFMYAVPASVAPGTKITLKNTDTVAHTVTSEAGGFDVKVNPNGTATLTAPSKPGSYPFVCTIHPDMTASLVVK